MKAQHTISNYPIYLLAALFLFALSNCEFESNPGANEDSDAGTTILLAKDIDRSSTPEEAAHFAWNVFMAINEPEPDGTGTQWENYKEAFNIFLPNAERPTDWGEPTPSNAPPCATSTSDKVLRTTSKVSPVVNETDQAVGGVLIDRHSNLVHYEVYMNKPMFNYVLDNQYYNAVKQAGNHLNFPTGSMELKAAWRILDPEKDDVSRYHTAQAIIYIPDSAQVRQQDCLPIHVEDKLKICSEELVGLVGLHVVYKTPSNPNFTWMTFEQIDNVDEHEIDGGIIPTSFRNDKKSVSYCPKNSRQCNCPEQETSQITRQNPIPEWVSQVNQSFRDSLGKANSVWHHYQLIGIQWAQDDTRTGNPLLDNLANTSMETFNQTASSCIGCHAFARTSNPTILSDFSWVMSRAQNPKAQLPDTSGGSLLKYIMRENPYNKWGTWPDSEWNIYSKATAGENPHGNSVRIFTNDIALDYYDENKRNLPKSPELPVGSIIAKENFRTHAPATPDPIDLVELTVMYKAENAEGESEWFWMKARPYGPVDLAGFDQDGCISCHMNWKGNGDGMLSFNFGKRPVITETPYSPYHKIEAELSDAEMESIKDFISSL